MYRYPFSSRFFFGRSPIKPVSWCFDQIGDKPRCTDAGTVHKTIGVSDFKSRWLRFKSCEEEKGVLSCTLTRVITDDYSCPSSAVKRKSFQQNQKTTVTNSSGLKDVLNRFVVFPYISHSRHNLFGKLSGKGMNISTKHFNLHF